MNRKQTKAALVGRSLSHSLSPLIYKYLADFHEIDFSYTKVELQDARALEFFIKESYLDTTFTGFNITIPYKESVMSFISDLDSNVKKIKSCNLVSRNESGKFFGSNTDYYGIERTIENLGFDVRSKKALVWGAGGASRAVCTYLCERGAAEINIINRDPERAARLVKELVELYPQVSIDFLPNLSDLKEPLDFICNASAMGMVGVKSEIKALPVLRRNALAFDLVYNPSKTGFLELASKQGCKNVGGLPMLVYQALGAWRSWFKKDLPEGRIVDLISKLEKELNHVD